MLTLATILAVLALAAAPSFAFSWTDNFESGLGNWANASGCTSLGLSTAQNTTPGGSYSAHVGDHAFDKMYHNLGVQITAGTWSISFNLFDNANYNAYGELRSYSGGTYPNGSFNQDIVAGLMSFSSNVALPGETYDSSKYQGRFISGSGATGWFNLNTSRTPGWHTFTITRTADNMVTWYVDGAKDRSFNTITNSAMNVVVIGASATGTNNAFFDDVNVTDVVPEPGSLLILCAGITGMIGILRRKSA